MKTVAVAILVVMLAAQRSSADGVGDLTGSMQDWNSGDFGAQSSAAQNFLTEGYGYWQGASTAAGAATTALQIMQQFNEMNQALSDLDRELRARMQDDHSGPMVPSSCGPGTGPQMAAVNHAPSCSECFDRAYREVTFTRNTLERLRTIYARTMAYIKRAESLGDTTSGAMGIAGLSWQYAKANVETEKANMIRVSKEKYEGLVANMRRALDMVAQCENEHFHNPDWYSRFGFMYFQFVKDAYAIHEE
jgi:hypothetical protein